MKKYLLYFALSFVIFNTTYAYSLTSKDLSIISRIENATEILVSSNYDKFLDIKDRVSNLLSLSWEGTRTYEILSVVSENMSQQDINNDLFSLMDDIDSIDSNTSKTSRIAVELISVADGDTIKVMEKDTRITYSVRMIWIDTPESNALRYWEVQKYWVEAWNYLKNLLSGEDVTLELDASQWTFDSYNRKLAYVFVWDKNINEEMIRAWFAYEYTYDKKYKYKDDFLSAQKEAKSSGLNIWSDNSNKNSTKPLSSSNNDSEWACNIKGNINSKWKKLFHYPGCPSYNQTKITESKGEKYFCSQDEARNEWWVVAGNC